MSCTVDKLITQYSGLKLFRFLGAESRLRGASTSNSAMHHVPVNLGDGHYLYWWELG